MNANAQHTLNGQHRFLLLVTTMAVVAVTVAGISLIVFYQAAFEEQRERLREAASAQARVIEVVAHHNAQVEGKDDSLGTTLSQIETAYDQLEGSRDGGELTLGTLEDDQIVFLSTRQQASTDRIQRVPLEGDLAEPMRRALSGETGTMVGLDYRGQVVLAAYQPVHVEGINLGIVAKIDVEAIRAPFVRAGLLAGGIGAVVIVLGSVVIVFLNNPIIRELAESEAKYRMLVERSLQSVLIIQNDPLRISFVNKTMRAATGYTNEELLNATPDQIRNMVHPADRELLFGNLAKRVKGEELPERIVYRLVGKNGDTHWMETLSSQIEYKGKPAVMAIFLDVTERIRAEEALRESEARYRSLFERVPVGLFRSQPGGKMIEANPALVQMLGYLSREDLLAANAADLFVSSEEHAQWRTLLERDGMVRDFEARLKRADGELIWCRGTVRAAKDQDEKFISYEGSLEDVTRRRKIEEEIRLLNTELEKRVRERTAALQTANEELEALGRVKDEFVSNVSHELRTPITTVKLYLQLLKQRPEQLDHYLSVLERESERLAQIIEGLLHFSLIDQDRVNLKLGAVDLNQLVRQYVADRRVLAEKKSLSLQFVDGVQMPPIQADTGLLGQVVSVLLTNAINYTPPGGTVTVRTQTRVEAQGRYAGFAVSDTGPGIPPDEIERIFERFFRGKVAKEYHVGGTGLGLPIARGIVERHQGRIEVEGGGEPGRGATFRVWLPAQEGEGEKPPTQS
jgi:PAS domain S-box-containing protein